MVLGFKKQFVKPIKAGIKIHTIREDKHNRWKPGRKIHGATGVRTKKYNQFFEDTCTGTQKIKIIYKKTSPSPKIVVDGKRLNADETYLLALHDGFPGTFEFRKWFNKDFIGKIIHWTDKRY